MSPTTRNRLNSTSANSSSQKLSANNSPSDLTLQVFTKQLNKLSDKIITEISNVRSDFNAKFDILERTWIDKFNLLQQQVNSLAEQINQVQVIPPPQQNGSNNNEEVNSLRQQIDLIERRELACDAVLFGVPMIPNENIEQYFNSLCSSLSCELTVKNIFRPKHTNPDNTPIVIKFNSVNDRNLLLKAATLYRENNDRTLRLGDK